MRAEASFFWCSSRSKERNTGKKILTILTYAFLWNIWWENNRTKKRAETCRTLNYFLTHIKPKRDVRSYQQRQQAVWNPASLQYDISSSQLFFRVSDMQHYLNVSVQLLHLYFLLIGCFYPLSIVSIKGNVPVYDNYQQMATESKRSQPDHMVARRTI